VTSTTPIEKLIAIVPAAGVGKRMKANCPKQYLTIEGKTILEHTVLRLLSHPAIEKVILAIGENDKYFTATSLAKNTDVITVVGGQERVDSVLSGLKVVEEADYPWTLIHDAARPCITIADIDALIHSCQQNNAGGLLACPVRDTMKLGQAVNTDNSPHTNDQNEKLSPEKIKVKIKVKNTVERDQLWHALTPQMYRTSELLQAITQAKLKSQVMTDESSAIELALLPSLLITGRSDNIKITQPDDLVLATFILSQQESQDKILVKING
jgi:2-C-methyl-D-erythritol 4-phosphate cytidylyltransferase